jgi:hypothetical protein
MNNFIYLNGKIFKFTDRKIDTFYTGGRLERTLNATGTIDRGTQKNRLSFSFDVDSRQLLRLKVIFDSSTITLVDWDGVSYTVIISSNFSPVFNGEDNYSITLEFEEV